MNKKEVSESVGIFTRISEKQAADNQLGKAIKELNNAFESPDTELTVKTPGKRPFVASPVKAKANRDEPQSVAVQVSEKLLLNITDCRLLTGLSNNFLRDAIKAGTLKAKSIGRGYKVKRQDLNEYVNNL